MARRDIMELLRVAVTLPNANDDDDDDDDDDDEDEDERTLLFLQNDFLDDANTW